MIEDLPLPSSTEAERFVLHSLMDEESAGVLLARLTAGHFATEAHRQLFETIAECRERYGQTERVGVCTRLKETGRLEAAGGLGYIVGLSEGLPHLTNPEGYADILDRYRERRELIRLGQWVHDAAFVGTLDPKEIKAQLTTGIDALTLGTNKSNGLKGVGEIIDEGGGVDSILNPSSEDGPEVTFPPLAKMIPRWERGRTVVIVALTGGGKSSLARQEALGVADRGGTVAVFSLEMSNAETLRAMVCTAAAVNGRKLQTDRTTEAERAKLMQAVNRLERGGIFISDSVSTVGEIATEIRKLKAKRGAVHLAVIDYMQLVRHLGKTGTRTEAVDAISRGLKSLAMSERVPLLILAQWNNEGAKAAADGGEPGEHQIRESGSISQDADRLVFLVPKKLDPGFTPEILPYRLIVKKNRNGPRGAVEIGFDGALTRFVEVN